MDNNSVKFNEGYKKRTELFKGYARCEHLTKLYDECLQANPVYIPKKFRDDKFYVRDEEELEIIQGRFMGKFQSEYRLLKKRQRDFATAVNTEDDIVYGIIEHCRVSDMVKTEMAAIWERDVKANEEKVRNDWAVNIVGMKTAYEKDKEALFELNQRRAKKFQEIRESSRAVDASTSPAVTVSTGQEGHQHQNSTRTIEINEDGSGMVMSVNVGYTNEEGEGSTETSEDHEDVNPVAVQVLDSQSGVELRSTEPLSEDSTGNITTFPSADEAIDSSAAPFDSAPDDSDFTTQDHSNIANMVGNFTATHPSQSNRSQSNYKFQKRSHLRY